jgi:hypothetical protein
MNLEDSFDSADCSFVDLYAVVEGRVPPTQRELSALFECEESQTLLQNLNNQGTLSGGNEKTAREEVEPSTAVPVQQPHDEHHYCFSATVILNQILERVMMTMIQ